LSGYAPLAHSETGDGVFRLQSRGPGVVQFDPKRVPGGGRGGGPGRRLLDHTEMHNIQILQDLKAAEMAAKAATFTYFPDVEEPQGYEPGCMERQAIGGPACEPELLHVRLALNKLYHATNGYWWKNNQNWRTTAHYCTWHSVGCDDLGIVRSIHMDDNQLTDWYNTTLPPDVLNITSLYEISMACNYLQGQLPQHGWKNLEDLQYLDLHGNSLKGEFPPELATLKRLLYIDLTYNELATWDFVNGQPSLPWQNWGQLTKIFGNGRIASPNMVVFEPNMFRTIGRMGTMAQMNSTNVTAFPGVGGSPPIDAEQHSYLNKVPVSENANHPPPRHPFYPDMETREVPMSMRA